MSEVAADRRQHIDNPGPVRSSLAEVEGEGGRDDPRELD